MIGHFLTLAVMVERRVVPLMLSGMSCEDILWRMGLGSNRSTCEGPPPCHKHTMRFAFGAKWGNAFGAPVVETPVEAGDAAPWEFWVRSEERAMAPMPCPAEPKRLRRVIR